MGFPKQLIRNPSKIEWDLTNGPLSKLVELLDTRVEGSVQWVLLEISWKKTILIFFWLNGDIEVDTLISFFKMMVPFFGDIRSFFGGLHPRNLT